MATPEFTFIRLANYFDEYQLIQTGIDLCAKYYLGWQTGKIRGRQDYITTPLSMADFASHANGMRGAVKTHDTLNWILANSGSPAETRLYIQFALPLRKGGFGLPLDAFNYDVRAEKLSGIMEQNEYSIDLVNSKWRIGIEYDGKDYHEDTWKDIRRRNELAVIGWRVFPTNMSTLYNPDATLRFGMQMRQVFKLRNRFPQCWEQKFEKLRTSIGLPV